MSKSILCPRRPRANNSAPAAHRDRPPLPTTATTNELLPPDASLHPPRAYVSSLCDSNFAVDAGVAMRRGRWPRSLTIGSYLRDKHA